jgi:hypothetical protein
MYLPSYYGASKRGADPSFFLSPPLLTNKSTVAYRTTVRRGGKGGEAGMI